MKREARSMHIALIAPGSRGDVQPYLALGKGLLEAGHDIRFVTHADFETLVTSHGLELWPIGGSARAVAQGTAMQSRLESGRFVAILSEMAKEARLSAVALVRASLAACRGTDLIIAGIGGLFIATAVAEKLDLPLVQAHYIPFTPTGAYPSFLVPKPPAWFGHALNRLSYRLAQQMMWQPFRSADHVARQEVLDLPAAPFLGPFDYLSTANLPILYGFSPEVIPPAPDWDCRVHVTGYWFLEDADDWTPPASLVEFLESGPPPIYVGFGSMSSRDPEGTADTILAALAQSHQRGILLSGWGGLAGGRTPDSVYVLDAAPFSWLFPRVAAVVHHGGAGTTSAGLRAGVPSVVVPFFGDQPFWGQRVADLGAGAQPIPRKRLTAKRLAEAIDRVMTDDVMRKRAAALGEAIRREDGVARAVEVIGEIQL
jgi:UDP:flavonoid glycosyltransferase YjiC (YdhE family)